MMIGYGYGADAINLITLMPTWNVKMPCLLRRYTLMFSPKRMARGRMGGMTIATASSPYTKLAHLRYCVTLLMMLLSL